MSQFFEFTSSGIKFSGFQDVRQSLKDAWETTFGVQLDDSPTSPDGHHIDLEAKTIYSVMEALQVVTTMMNRDQASGVFLDMLAAFLGIDRNEGEDDDSLRTRMASATVTGYATHDGMLTYLQDYLGSTIGLKVNDEPVTDSDGIPGHSFRVVVPDAIYDALEEKVESGDIDDADDYIAQLIWNCKPAGIRADGNLSGTAKDKAGLTHVIKFSRTESVGIDVSVTLKLYSEEAFPDYGAEAVQKAIAEWAATQYSPGKDAIPARFYTPILTVPGIESAVLKIRKTGGEWTGDTIGIETQQVAVIGSISVEIAG